jgi:ion channel-forming bestrophin family protein
MLLDKPIPPGYIFQKVKGDLMYVLLVSVIVLILTELFKRDLPDMPLTIPTFIGTAISILLSFKLNQSYDRWWEARKVWGSIVNDSRSLVIQLQSFVMPGQEAAIRTIAYRQIAWCYALGRSLRGLKPIDEAEGWLGNGEKQSVSAHANVPLALLQAHAHDIRRLRDAGHLGEFPHVQLDNTLVRLCDAQGKAERIKSTVFPVTYRLFLHLIIYLFVITLSISLKNVVFYFELPLLILISSAFFLLEKSATHMQDPFENRPTDTAVTAIARNIEINLKNLIGDADVPSPLPPEGFFVR